LYAREPGLWQADYDHAGFYWIDCTDQDSSILSFMRQLPDGSRRIAVVLNLTPAPRTNYRIGLPSPGKWREALNSDAAVYGGSNMGNMGGVLSEEHSWHGRSYSAALTLPPLSVVAFQPE
jgi:1,4-alpha-glucan branching enzyme